MIVRRIMTKNPIFTHPETPVSEARSVMDREKFGRLPVLDKSNRLVGIVTKKDLLKAGPSPATSLDMYEISYLLSKLKVEKVMTAPVLTVDEDEVVEEAARLMADNDISCLPVMRGSLLVGIVTKKDLFAVFVKAFGGRQQGVRMTFEMEEKPGRLAELAQAIAERGGNIVAFAALEGDDLAHSRGTLKIAGIDKKDVEEAVKSVGAVLEDIREC